MHISKYGYTTLLAWLGRLRQRQGFLGPIGRRRGAVARGPTGTWRTLLCGHLVSLGKSWRESSTLWIPLVLQDIY